jgi:hypothetical protein
MSRFERFGQEQEQVREQEREVWLEEKIDDEPSALMT